MKYLSIFIFIFLSCSRSNDATNEKETSDQLVTKRMNVNTQIVNNETFHQEIVANGIIEATHRSELRFRKGDIIDKIMVKNGQDVKKDQLIAFQDLSNEKNQYQQAKIAVAEAKNELIDLKATYGVLDKPDSLIKPEVLNTITIRSGLPQAKAGLESAKIAVRQSKIKAPFTGVVANLTTKEGNFIGASENFCILISQDQLDVIFNVLESQLPFLKMGQTVEVTPFANDSEHYKARVTEIDPFVNEQGLVRIKAHLKQPDSTIFDGMNVKVSIQRNLDSVVKIPKKALVKRSGRNVVFTVQDSLAKWNYVDIKAENNDAYAVQKGIKAGDTIIISNNMNLAHDARIKPTFIVKEEN